MPEKTSISDKIRGHSKLQLILRSSLVLGILAIMFLFVFTDGIANTRFSPNVDKVKDFNADAATVITETFNLEVKNLNITHNGSWGPGECLENQYLVTNTGTKAMYVRASFEGFWKRVLHRNTAKVTAIYNGQILSDSDQAHLSFGKLSPPYKSKFILEATKGLFDKSIPEPSQFPILWNSYYTAESTGNISKEKNNSVTVLSGYPSNCSGPAVTPYTDSKLSEIYPILFRARLNDPEVDVVQKYLGPELCKGLHRFKINYDQDGIPDGRTYIDSATGFKITLYKTMISDNYYFAYQANYPIYHLFSFDSNEENKFYLYYPTYSEGVKQDCELSQPVGDHGYITLYYCVPPLNPSITIVKQVSINYEAANWFDADKAPGPELMVSTPKFRFLVTNTGNVPLETIVVEDDVLGLIGTKDYLEAGESVEFIKDKYSYNEVYLETDNVTIELCTDTYGSYTESDWGKNGNYYYYLHKIDSGQSVSLCLKVCLTGTTGIRYDGAEFYLNSFFEAVQSENGMVHYNWGDNPYQ